MKKNNFDRYIKRSTQKTKIFYTEYLKNDFPLFDLAVIIPAYDEYPTFFKTIFSLEQAYLITPNKKIALIIVINNTESDKNSIKENNLQLLQELANYSSEFFIIPIDCASQNKTLPEKKGVGLARKIGMDFAIEINCPILASMDADTLVEKNYFFSIFDLFSKKNLQKPFFALTDFTHQKAPDTQEQQAILFYENYLKNNSYNLQKTGYPYFPIALGPTLVCTAFAYVEAGGMNMRNAGEDFYFLQKLLKSNILSHENLFFSLKTCVHPSSRISKRVPFGTGRVVAQYLESGKIKKINEKNYQILEVLLIFFKQISNNLSEDKIDFTEIHFKKLPSILQEFLQKENFLKVSENLFKNNKNSNLYKAFLIWFDGLKAIQLFHFLDSESNKFSNYTC
ncbi:MAG: glycosyltransferase [Treponemataceae bacterium]